MALESGDDDAASSQAGTMAAPPLFPRQPAVMSNKALTCSRMLSEFGLLDLCCVFKGCTSIYPDHSRVVT